MIMERVQVKVNAGICGFVTVVEALSNDGQMVNLKIISPCETIRKLGDVVTEVDAYAEIGQGFDGVLHQAVRKTIKGCCSGCVVPSGIYKAMQVAAHLALPAPATIQFLSEERNL